MTEENEKKVNGDYVFLMQLLGLIGAIVPSEVIDKVYDKNIWKEVTHE